MTSVERLVTSVLLIVAMATVGSGHIEGEQLCREPDLQELRMNLPHATPEGVELDPTYLNLPEMPQRLKLVQRFAHFWVGTRHTAYVSGPRHCHMGRAGPPLCATHFVLDYDAERVPRVLFHARCTCKLCRHVTGGVCQPVLTFRQVMRRAGCSNGVYVYRPAWEPVPVDCKCELPPAPAPAET